MSPALVMIKSPKLESLSQVSKCIYLGNIYGAPPLHSHIHLPHWAGNPHGDEPAPRRSIRHRKTAKVGCWDGSLVNAWRDRRCEHKSQELPTL